MSCSSSNKIQQAEAAKCMARLCTGTPKQIESLIEKGMISGFLAGLKLKDSEVVEQCLKGLGLIAEKHYKFREKIFEAQAVEKIVEALEDTKSLDVKRNGIFTLMTLCRQKPEPTYELISKAIPLFCHYLKNENDEQILIDASWGLSGASSTEKGVESILNCAIVAKIIDLMSHPDTGLLISCLKTMGNIISSKDERVSLIKENPDLISILRKLADSKKKNIRQEVFWILSNIKTENIMGDSGFVEMIIKEMKSNSGIASRYAVCILTNSTANCPPAQLIRLLENGVFECLVSVLDIGDDEDYDEKIVMLALEGINNCLELGKKWNLTDESGRNKFLVELEKEDGVEKIEKLKLHSSEKLSVPAKKITEIVEISEL